MFVAHGEELGLGEGAAHRAQETALCIHTLGDEVEVFLQPAHAGQLGRGGVDGGPEEAVDVVAYVAEGGREERFAGGVLADLAEDPGIADRVAADHHAGRAGGGEHGGGLGGGGDLAVGQHRATQAGDGAGGVFVVWFSAVEFLHAAAVHAEQVGAVEVDQIQEPFEGGAVVEADAGLHGEEAGRNRAQGTQNLAEFGEVAVEAAADVLAVDFRGGATKVEVDAGDGQAQQIGGGAGEIGQAFTDELGENGTARRVLRNRAHDVRLQARGGVDAEELGEEIVGRAVVGNHTHEGEIGDILHRRQRGERQASAQRRRERAQTGGRGTVGGIQRTEEEVEEDGEQERVGREPGLVVAGGLSARQFEESGVKPDQRARHFGEAGLKPDRRVSRQREESKSGNREPKIPRVGSDRLVGPVGFLVIIIIVVVVGFFGLLLEHAFEDFGHVLDGGENMAGDEDGLLLLEGEHERVAGAGIDFDDLPAELVLHEENDAGEEGAVVDFVDDDAFKGDAEAEEDVADQVVGERPVLLHAVHCHRDGVTHGVVDVDDEVLLVVAEKDGAAVGGGHHTFDGDFDDILLHGAKFAGRPGGLQVGRGWRRQGTNCPMTNVR